jgi:hypothetical protein
MLRNSAPATLITLCATTCFARGMRTPE